MITTDGPDSLTNAFGAGFENLAFIATHAAQLGIVMKGSGQVVDNCLFTADEFGRPRWMGGRAHRRGAEPQR
jgi:hypothetical protein